MWWQGWLARRSRQSNDVNQDIDHGIKWALTTRSISLFNKLYATLGCCLTEAPKMNHCTLKKQNLRVLNNPVYFHNKIYLCTNMYLYTLYYNEKLARAL